MLLDVDSVVYFLERLLEVDLANKTVGEVIHDPPFDIDFSMSEDCLQLSVSTPLDPSEGELEELGPVLC